jgi:hypothetical protein
VCNLNFGELPHRMWSGTLHKGRIRLMVCIVVPLFVPQASHGGCHTTSWPACHMGAQAMMGPAPVHGLASTGTGIGSCQGSTAPVTRVPFVYLIAMGLLHQLGSSEPGPRCPKVRHVPGRVHSCLMQSFTRSRFRDQSLSLRTWSRGAVQTCAWQLTKALCRCSRSQLSEDRRSV